MATAIAEPPHLTADLRALYLSTVASQWRPLAEQAARQRQAPADYLAQLVHLEVTGRRERRIQRRIQDARFPMLKTLDAFSFEAQPDLDRDAVLQVFDCRFVAEAANIVFVGGVGTGKTHLSIATALRVTHRPSRRSGSRYGPCGPAWTRASRRSDVDRCRYRSQAGGCHHRRRAPGRRPRRPRDARRSPRRDRRRGSSALPVPNGASPWDHRRDRGDPPVRRLSGPT